MVMIVDSAERNQFIIDTLQENGVPIEIKQLAVGDYTWNNFVIERKSMSDFVSSVVNGHLFDQLEDMVYNLSKFDGRAALIIHGDLDDVEYRFIKNWHETDFYKAGGEIFSKYPTVNLFWVPDDEAFATFLSAMYHQSFSRKIERLPFVKKTKNFKVNVLISTKCFSIVQAKRLLKGRSLRKIFNMTEDEITKIKGIGEVSAKKFIKFRGVK